MTVEHPDEQARLAELQYKARKRATLEDLELHYRRAKRREDRPASIRPPDRLLSDAEQVGRLADGEQPRLLDLRGRFFQ
jgi:hypothetical protein